MDIEKKVQILRACSSKKGNRCSSCPAFGKGDRNCLWNAMRDAATALSALQAENEKLRAELEQVKAERDAAVADVCAIIGEVEEIRRGYGVDNADADDAFAGLCESYCANNGHGCYKKGINGYYCANFKWRGQKED